MSRKRIRSLQSMAAEQILLAFEKADQKRSPGSSVQWEDLELAFTLARDAWPRIYRNIVAELDRQQWEADPDYYPGKQYPQQ